MAVGRTWLAIYCAMFCFCGIIASPEETSLAKDAMAKLVSAESDPQEMQTLLNWAIGVHSATVCLCLWCIKSIQLFANTCSRVCTTHVAVSVGQCLASTISRRPGGQGNLRFDHRTAPIGA
jgi:hypothetical protein